MLVLLSLPLLYNSYSVFSSHNFLKHAPILRVIEHVSLCINTHGIIVTFLVDMATTTILERNSLWKEIEFKLHKVPFIIFGGVDCSGAAYIIAERKQGVEKCSFSPDISFLPLYSVHSHRPWDCVSDIQSWSSLFS